MILAPTIDVLCTNYSRNRSINAPFRIEIVKGGGDRQCPGTDPVEDAVDRSQDFRRRQQEADFLVRKLQETDCYLLINGNLFHRYHYNFHRLHGALPKGEVVHWLGTSFPNQHKS